MLILALQWFDIIEKFIASEVKPLGVSRSFLTSIPLGNFNVLFQFAVKIIINVKISFGMGISDSNQL